MAKKSNPSPAQELQTELHAAAQALRDAYEKFNLVKLFRIVDISVERTFLQRLFGMSTLVLNTRDQSSGNGVVVLKNIVHGFEVRQMLQDAVDASRSENGMTAREFIGGPAGSGLEGPGFDSGFDDFDAENYAGVQ